MGWFLISKFCTQIRNGYQLIYKYLKNIPIFLDRTYEEDIEFLVNEVFEKRKVNSDVTDAEAEINNLVYKMYGLNDKEIQLVEKSIS